MLRRYADLESLLFWTNLPMRKNYTYPKHTPGRADLDLGGFYIRY
jgi:hypothetical protein